MLLGMVNENIQEALKKFQENKNKEKTQKQINGLIEALNKHQTETEVTINREKNELRAKIDKTKEEVNNNMETTEKRMKQKYKTKWKVIPAD
jgi:ElaB/YqjD/DUF883 family membrane-anchored ribosome-binding protein